MFCKCAFCFVLVLIFCLIGFLLLLSVLISGFCFEFFGGKEREKENIES